MRGAGLLVVACLAVLTGCSRQESGDPANMERSSIDKTPPVPEATDMPEEELVPRRPHPRAVELFRTGNFDSPEVDMEQLMRAADRYMADQIPDFAIKDAARPWLDRQYIPQSWQLRSEDGRVLCDLEMLVLRWDEGRPVEPDQISLGLEWAGSRWVLWKAPEMYSQDLKDARLTLLQNWQRGERQLP